MLVNLYDAYSAIDIDIHTSRLLLVRTAIQIKNKQLDISDFLDKPSGKGGAVGFVSVLFCFFVEKKTETRRKLPPKTTLLLL